MKTQNTPRTWVMAALAVASLSAVAQDKPKILTVPANNGGGLSYLSRNGQWACGDAPNPANESLRGFPRIVNTATGKETRLWTDEEESTGLPLGVNAVSDDGKTAVGNYLDLPAVWTEAGGWKQLETPGRNYNNGLVSDITPDGKYGVGRCSMSLWNEYPCMWDLETGKLIKLNGMVNYNPMYFTINSTLEKNWQEWLAKFTENHPDWEYNEEYRAIYEASYQNYLDNQYRDTDLNVRLTGVSPDGKAVIGMVDFTYPNACWEFVYYVDEGAWKPLGLRLEDHELKPLDPDIFSVQGARFSPDGSLIGGAYYSVNDVDVPFMCPTNDPENYTIYQDTDNMLISATGNDGILYGATPPQGTPLRNWSARVGNYWYDWKSVLRQNYGIDWMNDITKDETGYSGMVTGISGDNLTALATDFGNGTSYIISLPKPMKDICSDVDLLADYLVNPVDGAQFSKLVTVTVAFTRNVTVAAEKTAVQLLDENGEPVRNSINIATQITNPKCVDITFRPTALDPDKKYTLVIPAGAIHVAGDEERSNNEIRISYIGRDVKPVKPVSIFPEEGSSLPRLSYSTNPVLITFDAIIDATGLENGIRLYQVKDGKEDFLFNLSGSINGRQMLVYPVSEQRLADGYDYKIVFGEGIVADLSGEGANEEFSVTYHGSYVPEIDPSSNIIFQNDFEGQNFYQMLFYEGDHNTPTEEMQGLAFDADNTPWQFARDEVDDEDAYYNYAAMSHSQYSPAGKSYDWMVTPQLFIPDDKATLTFKSQSYRKGKSDYLKVFVYETDDIYTYLTESIIDNMRYASDPVYSQLQSPGASEDRLEGDWRENTVDLSKYAGKNIYIAFLNDNQNQSVVFVDDVLVSREVIALLGVDNETTVINEDEAVIKGRVVAQKTEGLDSFTLTLSDAEGNVLQTIEETVPLAKGETYSFAFPEAVGLDKGCINTFNVAVASEGRSVNYKVDIKNMLFRTKKHIVVEENTGTMCGFCPLGILGIENLKKVYGDLVIPITIRGYYAGDAFKTSENDAYSAFFGFQGAPMAVINRGEICNPMYSGNDGYSFTDPDTHMTFLDKAEEDLKTLAEADVEINKAEIDGETVKVDFTANFAIDRTDANINVFAVMMEDGMEAYQMNNLAGTEDPALGEWGKGGIHGGATTLYTYEDVTRGTSAVRAGNSYVGFNGEAGHIPSAIKAEEPIQVNFEFPLPTAVKEQANTKVCIMLIDAITGDVINAAVTGRGLDISAVDSVSGESAAAGIIFDMTGRIIMRDATAADLNGLQPGIYILNGRKYAVK